MRKKRLLGILLLTLCLQDLCAKQNLSRDVQPENLCQDISLCGEWQFMLPDGRMKTTVEVPHTYNTMEGLEDYAGEAVYSRELPVTTDMRGRAVRICFGGVYHDATVRVNGQLVGEHIGKGYTPFSFDITKALHFDGRQNTVEVRCSNAYTERSLPYMRSFDWSNDGGIYRPVRLHVSGHQTLRYVHVTPTVQLADSTGTARFDIRLYDGQTKRIKAELTITNRQTGRQVYATTQTLKQREGVFTLQVPMGRVDLWHFDHPNLYDFRMRLLDGKVVCDEKHDHFGFREFKIAGNRFALNGEPMRLPGIENMPGSNPRYGMAETVAFMDSTVRMMKHINCNITRFHWVQDEAMLSLMDSLGILAQEELSWWQKPYKELTPELRQIAMETIEEMIEAHYNHPCLYAWGISNEVKSNWGDLKLLGDHARKLDQTRIIDALCNFMNRNLQKDPSLVLDLPTWNEYVGTWNGKVREELPGQLQRIDSVLAGRPLFITEHGLCEPAYSGGDQRRIDEMIYHIKEWQRADFICGYIYFCLQDYRTQAGEEGLGKWRIRRHGVTHVDLTPKASYHVLRQIASPIEITKVKPARAKKNEDSLAGQYEVDAADRGCSVTLTVKQSIPSYILRGYTLQYTDYDGKPHTINLPDMQPGQSYKFVLENMNRTFAFSVLRPGGFSVIDY